MSSLLRLCLRLLFRVRCQGELGAAADDAVLYVAKHSSTLDSVILGLFLPMRPMVILPAEEFRRPLLRWLLRALPHALMEMSDPASIRKILRWTAQRRAIALFPEGRVTSAPGVMKSYDAPALIAARSGAAVIAVQISYRWGARPHVTIRLRPAIRLDPPTGASSRQRRAQAGAQLQRLLERAVFASRPVGSLFEVFLDAVAEQGRRTFIIEDMREEPRSYAQLLKGALAIGRWASRHTQPAENVGVLLPNLVPTPCTVLGLMAFARVPAMLNYSAGPLAVRSACTAAAVRTVITSRKFIEQARLAPVVEALSHLRLIYLEDIEREFGLRDKLWLMAYALWRPRSATRPGVASEPAVVVFTSGSEARPKGVVLSHEAILANIEQIRTVIDFTPRDKVLNPLPLYHTYSFTAGMMLCLLTGTKLFLYISPLRYRAIPEIAYRRDCTYLFGTSTFLNYYARNAHPLDFHTIRYVISGGEKLGEEVTRQWLEKFGLRIYEGYGATECAPVIALSTPQCYSSGTVGRLLPGIEHRLEKVAGIEQGGVLHLKGPNVMLGYYLYDNPGVIVPPRSMYGEGWYNTGDVVTVSEDGVLKVSGRVKRFAKIAGEMVPLDSIEEVARWASPEHQHAVVLRTESRGGETTVLFTTDPGLTRMQLTHAARELGRQDLAAARRVVCLAQIPLLASGKTDYVNLQSLPLDDQGDASTAPANALFMPQPPAAGVAAAG